MDIEFHYHMTYLIALRAGFNKDEAYTIAYTSQYVDDNMEPMSIVGGTERFKSLVTQTIDITCPKEEHLGVYPLFHFCPGIQKEVVAASPTRRDGHISLLATIPDNSNARTIFAEAMKTSDFYRIGIGTHMYADTFCHNDFTGWKDPFNYTKAEGWKGAAWSCLCPSIGHALAMHEPDIPSLTWQDIRLTSPFSTKSNKQRILNAAGKIFDAYRTFTKIKKYADIKQQLLVDLADAIGPEVSTASKAAAGSKARIKKYEKLIGPERFVPYDKGLWYGTAIDEQKSDPTGTAGQSTMTRIWKEKYVESDWYKFQLAAKLHRETALGVLHDTFAAMEIHDAVITTSE